MSSESQPTDRSPSPTRVTSRRNSPPRLSPSPEGGETEFKLSRKREREVSLEPATPSANNDIGDPLLRERKHSGLPLKKNRLMLDSTVEEEEAGAGTNAPPNTTPPRSGSGSPPITQSNAIDVDSVLTSPRQEMRRKVRQISQGVEDINWKGRDSVPITDKEDVEIEDLPEAPETSLESAIVINPPNGLVNGSIPEEKNADLDEETLPTSQHDTTLSHSVQDAKSSELDVAMQASPEKKEEEPNRLRAFSESNEKGLKRKYLERGTSQGPSEENGDAGKPTEPLKRPRDDVDKDDNPRLAKKPSPPPSPALAGPSSPKASKPTGFMAYASTTSPFASVKGQNIFSLSNSKAPSLPTFAPSPGPSTPLGDLGSAFGTTSSSTPAAVKRTGFEAFASTSSPFSSFARSKSPILGSTSKLGRAKSPPRSRANPALTSSAFSSYAGTSHGFGIPAQKRARAETPDGSGPSSLERTASPAVGVLGDGSARVGAFGHTSSDEADEDQSEGQQSFGAKLRAAKDNEDAEDEGETKVQLTEQDVATGEEDEETLHQVRGKLFTLESSAWKEKGTGLLKLNVKQDDGTGARLVMRKDAVYTLLLNTPLFPGMRWSLAQDPRYLRFTVFENGSAVTYNLKVSNAKIAQDLLEVVNANIPA